MFDDFNHSARSSFTRSPEASGKSFAGTRFKIPLSPRVVALRKSLPKSRGLTQSDEDPKVLHSGVPVSQNDERPLLSKVNKRPEVYNAKKLASEKRAIMKKSLDSLIFHSAESNSDRVYPQANFDADDLV